MNEDDERLRNRIAAARAKPDIRETGGERGRKPSRQAPRLPFPFNVSQLTTTSLLSYLLRDRTIHYGCHGEDKGNDDMLYLLSNLFVVLCVFLIRSGYSPPLSLSIINNAMHNSLIRRLRRKWPALKRIRPRIIILAH